MPTAGEVLKDPIKTLRLATHKPNKETLTALKTVDAPVVSKSKYKCLDELAQGNFSVVYAVERKGGKNTDKTSHVAKVSTCATSASVLEKYQAGSNLRGLRAADIHTIVNELKLLKLAQNPECVVELTDSFYLVQYGEEQMWMIMENIPLSLDLIATLKRRKLSVEETGVIACGLIKAVEHIHSKGIIHMDVKLENVLVSEDGLLKLCDFGLSEEFTPGETKYVKEGVGTVTTMALELWEEGAAYNESVDIWSLGVVVYMAVHSAPENCPFGQLSLTLRHQISLWWRAYQNSNEAYLLALMNFFGRDWTKLPQSDFEDYVRLKKGRDVDMGAYMPQRALSHEYREFRAFCARTLVPLPRTGPKRFPVTRNDTLERASLEELKALPLVKEIFENDQMQRTIVQSLIQEVKLKGGRSTAPTSV